LLGIEQPQLITIREAKRHLAMHLEQVLVDDLALHFHAQKILGGLYRPAL
jgi:hypothetical protein